MTQRVKAPFIRPVARGDAAASWGRARGCTELASDTEVHNETSAAAHLALGFAEVGVIRCFRKPL